MQCCVQDCDIAAYNHVLKLDTETGEWPTGAVSRRMGAVGLHATLDTPVGTPDPSRVGTPNHSEYSCAMDEEEVRPATAALPANSRCVSYFTEKHISVLSSPKLLYDFPE